LISDLTRRLTPDARITVMTGAGVSAASGVPTFRGADGLWKNFRVEALATPEAFASDPRLVWGWYDWRRQMIAACRPNAAHEVLASWSRRFPNFTLITQNVDGLHERAAAANASASQAQEIIRLHGSIWEVMCVGRRGLGEGGWRRCAQSPPRWRDETVPFAQIPPSCAHCGGLIRPGVVWFGEALDPDTVERATEASTECDVFITIGTSSIVYPAAGLVDLARRAGAFTVEINPEATPTSSAVDLVLRAGAETVLPDVDVEVRRSSTGD
jgi:NAD-dependent deacetylase